MNSDEKLRTSKRFSEIYQSLKPESDRGCVLVVGSMVERFLEDHISRRLLPKLSPDDELMGRSGNKPIAVFSAKINLAYRLGLITAAERTIYHQLRELRNACAHHIDRQEFAANHFKDRTRNIIEQSANVWEALREEIAPALFPNDPPTTIEEFIDKVGWRVAFETFFALVVAHKEASVGRVARLSALHESITTSSTSHGSA
ncbi:MAG: hypothetical protein WC256_07715 [Desulfurivibrionaceae bacterium]|jgi:hypothetical protein